MGVIVAVFQLLEHGVGVAIGGVVFRGVEIEVARWVLQESVDFSLPQGEGIGDVFQEDEAEDGVLVNRGVEIGAEAVSNGPELFVEIAEELLGIGGRHGWEKERRTRTARPAE